LTAHVAAADDRVMADEELEPREAARTRRRDRDASAAERDLLRPGMGKVFKQILDRQGRVARDARVADAARTPKEPRPSRDGG
jgi:hypothetical protein